MKDFLVLPDRLVDHVLTSGHFVDLGVYSHLCRLDDQAADSTFRLPHRDDMARVVHTNAHALARSYRCLSHLGLLTFAADVAARVGVARRVKLERVRVTITAETLISEGITPAGRVFAVSLVKRHAACRRSDKHSNTLADFPLEYLAEISGNPRDPDLARAIAEVESFDRPAAGIISSIVGVFLSRFTRDQDNQPTGRLDPRRANMIHEISTPKKQLSKSDPHLEADLQRCNIYPTKEFSAPRIDAICERLIYGIDDVLAGDVPLYILEKPSIQRDESNRLSLSPGASLVKVQAGYWVINWPTGKVAI